MTISGYLNSGTMNKIQFELVILITEDFKEYNRSKNSMKLNLKTSITSTENTNITSSKSLSLSDHGTDNVYSVVMARGYHYQCDNWIYVLAAATAPVPSGLTATTHPCSCARLPWPAPAATALASMLTRATASFFVAQT